MMRWWCVSRYNVWELCHCWLAYSRGLLPSHFLPLFLVGVHTSFLLFRCFIVVVFISHLLDTSISRSLYIGRSSNSFVGPFMSDGILKIQYLVIWFLIIIIIPVELCQCWLTAHPRELLPFHFLPLLLVGVHNKNFDVTVSADTLVDMRSNIVMSGYVLCFSQYWTTKDSIIDSFLERSTYGLCHPF